MSNWKMQFVLQDLFNFDLSLKVIAQHVVKDNPIPNLRDEIEINKQKFWISGKTFNFEKQEITLVCMKK